MGVFETNFLFKTVWTRILYIKPANHQIHLRKNNIYLLPPHRTKFVSITEINQLARFKKV